MTTQTDKATDTLANLAGILDRFEDAQDNLKAAFARKRAVTDEIREALGIENPYTSDDKLTAALLRALVNERQEQRKATA